MSRYLIIATLLIVVPLSAYSQKKFTANAFLGFTSSQVQGDGLAGFDKAGFTAGIGIHNRINKKWGWGFELSYVQKGSKSTPNADSTNFNYYKMSLHYAEIPIYLTYKFKKIRFEAGPTFGILIGATEESYDEVLPIVTPFKSYEIGIMGGVTYQYSKKIGFRFRSSESIFSIRNTPAYAKGAFGRFNGQYNTVLSLQIIYNFL